MPFKLQPLEIAGAVAGFIPVISIVPGVIKAVVYYQKSKENPTNQQAVENTAAKTEGVANKAWLNTEKECYEVLWKAALAEIIPGVNIIAAIISAFALSVLSNLREVQESKSQGTVNKPVDQPKPDSQQPVDPVEPKKGQEPKVSSLGYVLESEWKSRKPFDFIGLTNEAIIQKMKEEEFLKDDQIPAFEKNQEKLIDIFKRIYNFQMIEIEQKLMFNAILSKTIDESDFVEELINHEINSRVIELKKILLLSKDDREAGMILVMINDLDKISCKVDVENLKPEDCEKFVRKFAPLRNMAEDEFVEYVEAFKILYKLEMPYSVFIEILKDLNSEFSQKLEPNAEFFVRSLVLSHVIKKYDQMRQGCGLDAKKETLDEYYRNAKINLNHVKVLKEICEIDLKDYSDKDVLKILRIYMFAINIDELKEETVTTLIKCLKKISPLKLSADTNTEILYGVLVNISRLPQDDNGLYEYINKEIGNLESKFSNRKYENTSKIYSIDLIQEMGYGSPETIHKNLSWIRYYQVKNEIIKAQIGNLDQISGG